MVSHMKTTIEIPDSLLGRVKEVCRREGTTLRALVEEGLRGVVERRAKAKRPFKLKDASYGAGGMHPNVRDGGWERLRDLAYEGRGS